MIARSTDIKSALRSRQRGFLLNPYRFAPAVASPTILLLHGEGANGLTTFTDSSPAARPITTTGAMAISTAAYKFGSSSLANPSTYGGLYTGDAGTGLHFPGDFTIEAFIYATAYGSGVGTICRFQLVSTTPTDANGDLNLYFDRPNGRLRCGGGDCSISGQIVGVSLNTWYHVAVTRQGSQYRLFRAGALDGEGTYNPGSVSNKAVKCIQIGQYGASTQFFKGHIDEVRITKGVALYTAAFTPPAAPFPDA